MFARDGINTINSGKIHKFRRNFIPLRRTRFWRRIGLKQSQANLAKGMRYMIQLNQLLFFRMRADMMKQRMPETAEREQQNRSEKNAEGWSQTFSLHGIIK